MLPNEALLEGEKRATRRQICNQNTKHRSKTSPAEHRGGGQRQRLMRGATKGSYGETPSLRRPFPPRSRSPVAHFHPRILRTPPYQDRFSPPSHPVARPVSPGVRRSPAERLIIPLIHRPFRSHRSSLVPCATDQRSLRLTLPRTLSRPPVARASA